MLEHQRTSVSILCSGCQLSYWFGFQIAIFNLQTKTMKNLTSLLLVFFIATSLNAQVNVEEELESARMFVAEEKFDEALEHLNAALEVEEDALRILIKDSGIGIDSDDLDKIFQRLYRADKSRTQKGQGLGLSLVEAVINTHGGSIQVKSEINQGTCFTIEMQRGLAN